MDYAKESLRLHREWQGKLRITPKMAVDSREQLSLAYTPGVAEPCLEIARDPSQSYTLTGRGNTVAVITNGTAVLGLGDIGPEASMPVMEGKCVLFSAFGGVDAVPLCINTKDPEQLAQTIALLAGSFGGINLEDIAAPHCFAVEQRLKELCDIPVFHDDQHGTAIVVAAALLNAVAVTGKEMGKLRIVINGAGAAGIAIAKLLLHMEFGSLQLCDIGGILCPGDDNLTPWQQDMAARTNPQRVQGKLADALVGADVFIGVSRPGLVTGEMVASMNGGIVFAMANPVPEIMPDLAKEAGAAVVGTGRSDFANQINNVLAFPGVFRGALDVRARDINEEMKLAAAYAIAELVGDARSTEYILPEAFDKRIGPAVAKAVAAAARKSGVARL